MRRSTKWKVLLCAAVMGSPATTSASRAQDYPTRPVTMVVPFAAGGPSDVIARILADHMSKTLGQQVVVENVGGAGGTLGSARVAASAPDGYTILAGSMGSHVAAPVLYANLKYDSTKDFEPISLTAHAPVAIVARKDFPAQDLRGFLAYVKENGDKVKQAHGGVGASSHMACLLFNAQLGLKPSSIAYRGTGPAMNDLVGGHVDFICEQVVSVAEQVNSGTIKGYAVTGGERSAGMPNVPTTKEAGAPEYQMSIWSGMFAPKGTPREIVARLADAVDKALEDPALRKRLLDLGGAIPTKDERVPANFNNFVKAEVARWSPILKSAGAEAK